MITTGQPDRGCYGMKQETDQQKLLKALRKLRKRNRELLRPGKVKVQQPEHGHFTDILQFRAPWRVRKLLRRMARPRGRF
jgi:hypothetical protein